MASHVFYGYSSNALRFDPNTGSFQLDPDYDFRQDRNRFEVEDDDTFFDGDRSNDEVGEDVSQTGTVFDGNGSTVVSGNVYVEQIGYVQAPSGRCIALDRIEINGVIMGYVPSEPLVPGVQYTFVGGQNVDDGDAGNPDTRAQYNYHEAHSVACFGPGTMLATQEGELPVEWLETGDMVLTRDNGFQPILWIGRTKLTPAHFEKFPNDAPICIPAGALDVETPTHDLHLTEDHRVLVHSALAEMLFFSSEVLAPAKAWMDQGVAHAQKPDHPITLTYILCENHQIISAQGAWVESMFTSPETLARMNSEDCARLRQLLGDRIHSQETARPCISRKEARLLIKPPSIEHIAQENRRA